MTQEMNRCSTVFNKVNDDRDEAPLRLIHGDITVAGQRIID